MLTNSGAKRLKYTVPAMVMRSLQLAREYSIHKDQDEMWEKKCSKIFSAVRNTILLLTGNNQELSLKLFLQAALTVNDTPFEKSEAIAYEFFSQVGE